MMELAALRRNKKRCGHPWMDRWLLWFPPRCVTRIVLMKPLVVWNYYKINMWAERIENKVLEYFGWGFVRCSTKYHLSEI